MRKILLAASLAALGVSAVDTHASAVNTQASFGQSGWVTGGSGESKKAHQGQPLWISIAGDAVRELQQVHAEIPAFQSTNTTGHQGAPIVARVDERQLSTLSRLMHDNHRRCGGYMVHDSFASALHAARASQLTASFEIPPLEQAALVTPALAALNQSNIQQTIDTLSNNFTNRFYTTSHGVNASDWLRAHWQQMTAERDDVTVAQFSHDAWPQQSVIVTINGTKRPDEVVVIGGHLDSTIGSSTGENSRAPGADDDASGIATVTEVLRVLMAEDFRPDRTLQFMAYAAEEVGLRGSANIADSYWLSQRNVVGVMQLDMTGYNGSASDITLISDYTNSNQNTYLTRILDAYLPSLNYTFDPCGYACSDHASWHNAGYVTSMPFEAEFGEHNQLIHTPNDTIANIAPDGAHAIKFAKLATAYAIELANADNTSLPPPVPTITPLVNGEAQTNLGGATGSKTYFQLDVPQGAEDLQFAMSGGSGDADLYVRFGGLPSTGTWDCRPYQGGNVESCSIANAEAGSYFVMINGYAAYSGVRLEASFNGGDPVNLPPIADFEFTRDGDTLSFTSTATDSDGAIASWHWDFGDGNSGNGENVSHTFAPGVYTVTLTVTDDDGASDSASQPVIVEADNQAPNASFTMQQNGDTIAFTSTASDSDGSIASWQWDFGDGNNGNGENVSHTFAAGAYTVTLTVTDDDGASDSASQPVTIEPDNQAPNASFTMQQNGDTIAFTSTASDSDGSIANWHWDFGDGNNGVGENVSHTFAAGTYMVTLSVTDDDGAIDSASQPVTIDADNQAPTASFEVSWLDGRGSFVSTSQDGDGTISSWQWDFGDGSSADGAQVQHQYSASGTYTVTLRVTDNDGASASTSETFTVEVPDTTVALAIHRAYKSRMGRLRVDLQWQGATSQQVEIYRNGALVDTVANTGRYRDAQRRVTGDSFTYKICAVGGSCSNEQTVNF